MPTAEYAKTLVGAGLPRFLTDAVAGHGDGTARGGRHSGSQGLPESSGRSANSPNPVSRAIVEALRQNRP